MLFHVRDGGGKQIGAVAVVIQANEKKNPAGFLADGAVALFCNAYQFFPRTLNHRSEFGDLVRQPALVDQANDLRQIAAERSARRSGMTVNSISMLQPQSCAPLHPVRILSLTDVMREAGVAPGMTSVPCGRYERSIARSTMRLR